MSRRLRVTARAKLNLGLAVGPVRRDGFHELATVFQSISLADTLDVGPLRRGFSLSVRFEGDLHPKRGRSRAARVPGGPNNLVLRAARLFAERTGFAGGARFRLVKRIPARSGLGGGSADAAAALLVLARAWGGAPLALLRDVAGTIGADVPYFLSGGTALGLGRGEEIYPLVDLPKHWIVVAQPPYGVSTAEAYAWYDEDRAAGHREPREPQILPVPWPTRAAQMINDLEPPVVRRHPEIGALKTLLREAGAVAAAMSGSGSAVFGLFRTQSAAARAVKAVSGTGGVRARLTRTLSRTEHERRARPVATKSRSV